MIEYLIGALIGLMTFFLYPIIEYLAKKVLNRNHGNPELWFLPDYCFRLVIRNMPSKVRLYDLKYKTKVRKEILSSSGSSVSTLQEEILVNDNDFFLLPGFDQVILAFRLEVIDNKQYFILTDKLGEERSKTEFDNIDIIISDYFVQIANWFHFNVIVGRRIEITKKDLEEIIETISEEREEQQIRLKKIIKIV